MLTSALGQTARRMNREGMPPSVLAERPEGLGIPERPYVRISTYADCTHQVLHCSVVTPYLHAARKLTRQCARTPAGMHAWRSRFVCNVELRTHASVCCAGCLQPMCTPCAGVLAHAELTKARAEHSPCRASAVPHVLQGVLQLQDNYRCCMYAPAWQYLEDLPNQL